MVIYNYKDGRYLQKIDYDGNHIFTGTINSGAITSTGLITGASGSFTGAVSIGGVLTLDADDIAVYDANPTFTADAQIITKKYVDDINLWQRSGTTLSPKTSTDNVSVKGTNTSVQAIISARQGSGSYPNAGVDLKTQGWEGEVQVFDNTGTLATVLSSYNKSYIFGNTGSGNTNGRFGIGTNDPTKTFTVSFADNDTAVDTGRGLGGGGNAKGMLIINTSSTTNAYANLDFRVGSNDCRIAVDSTGENAGNMYFIMDNSGNYEKALTLNNNLNATFAGNLQLSSDSTAYKAGASNDLQIFHDGSHSYIQHENTGDLKLSSARNNGDIQMIVKDSGGTQRTALQLTGAGNATFAGLVSMNYGLYIDSPSSPGDVSGDDAVAYIRKQNNNDWGLIVDAIYSSSTTYGLYVKDEGSHAIYVTNASGATFRVQGSDGAVKVGKWEASAITDSYISSASNWNSAYNSGSTRYTHPSGAGNKHIPSGGSSGQFLKYSSSGTATWATPSYTSNQDISGKANLASPTFTGTLSFHENQPRFLMKHTGTNGNDETSIEYQDKHGQTHVKMHTLLKDDTSGSAYDSAFDIKTAVNGTLASRMLIDETGAVTFADEVYADKFYVGGNEVATANYVDSKDHHTKYTNAEAVAAVNATSSITTTCNSPNDTNASTLQSYTWDDALAAVRVGNSAPGGREYNRVDDYTSDTKYHTGVLSHGEISFNTLLGYGSGFIDTWSSPDQQPSSESSHWNGFQALHYTDSSNYHHGMQMVMGAGNPAYLYARGWWASGGSGYAWAKIYNSANLNVSALDIWSKVGSYAYFNNWLRASANQGIYWPDSTHASSPHLYADSLGDYGSLRLHGKKGGYSGLSLAGRVVFMHDEASDAGLFNDVDNHWMIHHTLNGATSLYHAGVQKLQTTSGGVKVHGPTANIRVESTTANNVVLGDFVNSGDTLRIGLENNNGGGMLVGGSGFAGVVTTIGNHKLQFGTNETKRLTLDEGTGNATFAGTVGIGTDPDSSYSLKTSAKIYVGATGSYFNGTITVNSQGTSSNWYEGYTKRMQWDGAATGISSATTARNSLNLGSTDNVSFGRVTVGGSEWLYVTGNKTGIYNSSQGRHLYCKDGNWEADSANGIKFVTSHDSAAKMWPAYHNTNGTGMLMVGDWWLNSPRDSRSELCLGGDESTNSYHGSPFKLMFSGGDSDSKDNYYIGTNRENYNGDYNKLELRWHTGIRIGAQTSYGGVRFYNTEDLTSRIFSVGEGDNHVRVFNNLYCSGYILGNNSTEIGDYGNSQAIKRIRMVQGGEVHFGDTTTSNFLGVTEGVVDNFSDQDKLSLYYRNELRFFSNNNVERFSINASGHATFTNNLQAVDITATQFYCNDWFRNNASGEGMYNQATSQHWYSDDDDYWNVAGGGSANGIRFRDDHNGTVRGAVYATSSNEIGFLDKDHNWCYRHTDGGSHKWYTDNTDKLELKSNGDLFINASQRTFQPSYNGSASYQGNFGWRTLQLGNNGRNYFLIGNTGTGGSLEFKVNNTSNETGAGTGNGRGILMLEADYTVVATGRDGNQWYKPQIHSRCGGLSLLLGALNGSDSYTANTTKVSRLGGASYNTSKPVANMVHSSTSTKNEIHCGGGSGVMYVPNEIHFSTAGGGSAVTWSSSYIRMTVETNGLITGDFNQTSDVALKENIVDIEDATAVIKALQPRKFDWKESIKGNNVSGFIAQEVETVLPSEVSGADFKDRSSDFAEDGSSGKSVNTVGILAQAVKCIQELEARIAELESA